MKNVSLGIIGYSTRFKGFNPSLSGPRDGRIAVWAAEILPHIDARSVADHLVLKVPPDMRLAVLVCPDDEVNDNMSRGLSYVLTCVIGSVTAGTPAEQVQSPGLDWDNNGEVTKPEDLFTEAPGVFRSGLKPQNESFPIRRLDQGRRSQKGDGASHTLMMSERNRLRDRAVPPGQATATC